jgi:hypothetical protein
MRHRSRIRADVYWPAFVDIFVVLFAISFLAAGVKPPPPICNPPNQCTLPPKAPPEGNNKPPSMTREQYLYKRRLCHLNSAVAGLPASLKAYISGDVLRIPVPGNLSDTGTDLPSESKNVVDQLKKSLFESGLTKTWRDELSLELNDLTVHVDSIPGEYQAAESHAKRLKTYLDLTVMPVTWRVTANPDLRRPQIYLAISSALSQSAQNQGMEDRNNGVEPCRSSPK